MAIKIIAKKEGFRRAGLAHYGTRVYPDGHFSPEQLEILKAEKNLAVTETDEEAPPETPAEPETPTGPETPAEPEVQSPPETPAEPEVQSPPETPAKTKVSKK